MRSVFTKGIQDVSVSSFLASRGFKVRSQSSTRQTVLSRTVGWTDEERDLLFNVFHVRNDRRQLRAYIAVDSEVESSSVQ